MKGVFVDEMLDEIWRYEAIFLWIATVEVFQTKARLIKQYGNIFSNISDGTVFLLQSVTENDSG